MEATIQCLLELGYAGTTTTVIARRAGVSRGAEVHHFPVKADLVAAAVAHLARRRGEELRRNLRRVSSVDDRVSAAIDLIWGSYSGPLFPAFLELLVAARTDASLRPTLTDVEGEIRKDVEIFWGELFGLADVRIRPFQDALSLTLAFMPGLALSRLSGDRHGLSGAISAYKSLVTPLFEEAIGWSDGPRDPAPAAGDGRRG